MRGAATGFHVAHFARISPIQAVRSKRSSYSSYPGEPDATLERPLYYLDRVAELGYDYNLPIQNGISIRTVVALAQSIDAAGIFVGRGIDQTVSALIKLAHDEGLGAHISRPGTNLTWARDLGADSVDTTTIVRNWAWERLRRVENSRESHQLSTEVFY